MSLGSKRHVGGSATLKTAIKPSGVSDTSAAFVSTQSVIIDRKDATSALLKVSTGPSTGTPATIAVDAKVEESDDSGMSGSVDVSGAAITQITAVATNRFIEMDLSARKRYLRVLYKVTLTGGSSPTVGVDADLCLGGFVNGKPTHA